jgi:hypothetical protein
VTALYTKFLVEANVPLERQALASVTAKEYLTKFGECTAEPEKKITEYLRTWLDTYEGSIANFKCTTAVDKHPARAFEICKPYVARDPENLRASLLLSNAGIKTRSDKSLRSVAVKSFRKALELVKSGKTVERWHVADSKDEAVATLEFYSAYYTIEQTPADTATAMYSLARSTTSFSKDPNVFFYLAQSIQQSELKKLKADYVAKCSGTDPPDECDAAWAKVESVMDRVIDAYARSIAHSAGKQEFASIPPVAKTELVKLYKVRHANYTDAELEKYLTGILSTPLP